MEKVLDFKEFKQECLREGLSPSQVAERVFSQQYPPPEKSVQLYCESDIANTNIEYIDLFEIFLTILMEGIFIKCSPVNTDTLKHFDANLLDRLRPWLKSMGFDINVSEYPPICDELTKKEHNKYYCRVALKCDPTWETYFEMRNITNNYHFIFGGNSPNFKKKKCTFDNLYCIFEVNHIIYKIQFKFI